MLMVADTFVHEITHLVPLLLQFNCIGINNNLPQRFYDSFIQHLTERTIPQTGHDILQGPSQDIFQQLLIFELACIVYYWQVTTQQNASFALSMIFHELKSK